MTKLLAKHIARMLDDLPRVTDPAAARRHWVAWRNERGVPTRGTAPELLTRPDHNAKLAKTAIPTYGLSLSPYNLSGYNACPYSTKICRWGCLNKAGKGTLSKVQRGRILKTQYLAEHPNYFLCILADEIMKARDREGGAINVRLNVFSDIEWETIAPELFFIDGVSFYDYTKNRERFISGERPANYHLTFSASERDTDAMLVDTLRYGNVAMVFDKVVPETWIPEIAAKGTMIERRISVVNGDSSDDRTIDPYKGIVVGLKAKGPMRNYDKAKGFVRKAES